MLAFSVAMAVIDVAPLLAERRPRITYVAKAAPKNPDELPLPAVSSVDEVVALYVKVGRQLAELAHRDRAAAEPLAPRYRHIRILDAIDLRKRRTVELRLVELRAELAQHAN